LRIAGSYESVSSSFGIFFKFLIEQLIKTKKVEEVVRFGNQVALTFALTIDASTQSVAASLVQNNLQISLPETIAQQWINSNQVGIEVNNKISEENSLHILIEKDFPCLDRENEDKSDTFWELASKTPDAC